MTERGDHTWGPPRLLLGGALLFWGGVTSHPLIGLLCAFLVEARWWTSLRWNFGERGFVRAWALSLVLGLFALLWYWLKGESIILLFDFLVWMPVFLLPILLAQLYSTRPLMPLNTFSFIARRKMLIDRAAGRAVDPIMVHVGYPYLCLLLVASALGNLSELVFFVGLLSLMGVAFFAASPFGRRRPFSWSLGLVMVAIFGGGMAIGLSALYHFLGGTIPQASGMHASPDISRTAIGQLGRIKQSFRVIWRVKDPNTSGARLFREAVYNRYGQGQWAFKPVVAGASGEPASRVILDRDSVEDSYYEDLFFEDVASGEKTFAFEQDEFARDPAEWQRLVVTGRVQTVTPLPLPGSTQRLSGVRASEGSVDYNELGTVRLVNPDQSVASIEVYYGGPPRAEEPPNFQLDLQVPSSEWPGIAEVVDAWGLRGVTPREALRRIQERFNSEFDYTMHLGGRFGRKPNTLDAVSTFLTTPDERGVKAGHCEYFATAAVLLLREAGIPARYCVGFSAQERRERSDEWVLRGRHAHAWVRVAVGGSETSFVDPQRGVERVAWTGGRWIDFDPTPPDWLALEGSVIPWRMRILDWWQRVREEFLLWRTNPTNSSFVNWGMGIVGTLLLVYISVRLWLSRIRAGGRQTAARGRDGRGPAITPLHRLGRLASKRIGERPESQAFTEWILQLEGCLPVGAEIRRAVDYHWKARFDPIGLEPAEEREFEEICEDLRRVLKGRLPKPV